MRKIYYLFIIISLFSTNLVYSQKKFVNQKKPDVVTLFKNIVKRVDNTFKASPVVLTWQKYPSKSGFIYYKLMFDEVELRYDVQQTNSLISPYTGYIILKVLVKSNAKNGDVAGYDGNIGFTDSTGAKQSNDYQSCAHGSGDINAWCMGEIKVNYAFQDEKWVFKSIETETSNKIANGSTRGDIQRGTIDNLFKN
jgi:hypothetical protein